MSSVVIEEAARGELPPLVPITVDQFHQMIRSGIVREGDPIELIDGLLVRKDRSRRGDNIMSHGPRHALLVSRLVRQFAPWSDTHRHHVQVQLPVVLTNINAPEPDIAIVRDSEEDFATQHPGPNDVVLVIEVADSSLATDRSTKQRLYASAGIPDYWLVNLPDSQVEVFEQPDTVLGKYQRSTIVAAGEALNVSLPAGKELVIDVGELLR